MIGFELHTISGCFVEIWLEKGKLERGDDGLGWAGRVGWKEVNTQESYVQGGLEAGSGNSEVGMNASKVRVFSHWLPCLMRPPPSVVKCILALGREPLSGGSRRVSVRMKCTVRTCVTGSRPAVLQLLLPCPPPISTRLGSPPPLCHVSGALEEKNKQTKYMYNRLVDGSLGSPWASVVKWLNRICKSEAGRCVSYNCISCQNLNTGRFHVKTHVSSFCNKITRLHYTVACWLPYNCLLRLRVVVRVSQLEGASCHLPESSPLSHLLLWLAAFVYFMCQTWKHWVCYLPVIICPSWPGFSCYSLWLSLSYELWEVLFTEPK